MADDAVPFKTTHSFSKLFCDYLDQSPALSQYYNRFPNIENFKSQINEKLANFDNSHREALVRSLMRQYGGVEISALTLTNLDLLRHDTTFTITTGHQLNLFTGPLYFFYKIISVINLCKELKTEYPEYNFVPVYWMATEDHDFDEINFFNFEGKKIRWNRDASGAVGQLDLEGLEEVYKVFSSLLNVSDKSDELRELFKNTYLNHENLASSMRYLVNELFKSEGLIIVDGNDSVLKEGFKTCMAKDIIARQSYREVSKTIAALKQLDEDYKIQVNPREINQFYIKDGLRERIIESDGRYIVNDTDYIWDEEGILAELEDHPERFSPNVIMRPLYQEVVLPNLCYIGGGGELGYWFQLKGMFDSFNVTFPILLPRNSALIITAKQRRKLESLNVTIEEMFLPQDELRTLVTHRASEIDINFSSQKKHLHKQFEALYALAEKTDGSFVGAVSAQERKQINGLEHLEKRLLRAQKRKLADHLERVIDIQNQLFPNHSLQERHDNFSQYYQEHGEEFKRILFKNLDPLQLDFRVINV